MHCQVESVSNHGSQWRIPAWSVAADQPTTSSNRSSAREDGTTDLTEDEDKLPTAPRYQASLPRNELPCTLVRGSLGRQLGSAVVQLSAAEMRAQKHGSTHMRDRLGFKTTECAQRVQTMEIRTLPSPQLLRDAVSRDFLGKVPGAQNLCFCPGFPPPLDAHEKRITSSMLPSR
jgi:hypothetical protein